MNYAATPARTSCLSYSRVSSLLRSPLCPHLRGSSVPSTLSSGSVFGTNGSSSLGDPFRCPASWIALLSSHGYRGSESTDSGVRERIHGVIVAVGLGVVGKLATLEHPLNCSQMSKDLVGTFGHLCGFVAKRK